MASKIKTIKKRVIKPKAIKPPDNRIIATDDNQPFEIEVGTLSLFIAMTKSGKSYLQRYLLKSMVDRKVFKWVYVISPTKFNGEWSGVVGDKNVSAEFNEAKVLKLLDFLSNKAKKGIDYPGLLILDDCMGSVKFNSPIFTKLASTGRHYAGLTVWCSFQYYKAIPTVMRNNAAYMFMLNQVNEKVCRALLEEKANLKFRKWDELQEHISQETENYGAAVICAHDRNRPILTIRAPINQPDYVIKLGKPIIK